MLIAHVGGPLWMIIALVLLFQPATCLRAGQSPPPLNIGSDNQVLADNYVIEKSTKLQRVMHQPEKFPGNPVLRSDQSWENGAVFLNGGPAVVWDSSDH